ncbi:MAG: acyltransferase [Tractidigestivibacter sp.]|nr:acyltransferase [Tractidigestivibacter sp.]MDY5272483.1 acyltransferase [Tractidigestivibacter sp.]
MDATIATKPKKTILCFEWARGFAAAMVVLLHVTQGIMANYPISVIGKSRAIVWTVTQFLLTRWAVPVFLMIPGALLLNPEKQTSWKDVWRYERRVALVLAAFGYIFCLMEQYAGTRQLSPELFGISALNLLSGRSWSHLWYLYAMMGIYVLLPMVKAYASSVGPEDLRIFLIILFVLTVCIPSLNSALSTAIDTLIWLPSYLFYFLLGYYAFNYIDSTPPPIDIYLHFPHRDWLSHSDLIYHFWKLWRLGTFALLGVCRGTFTDGLSSLQRSLREEV